jgi:hypothetical protein
MFDTQASKPTIGQAHYGRAQYESASVVADHPIKCIARICGPLFERCVRSKHGAGFALMSIRNQCCVVSCAT